MKKRTKRKPSVKKLRKPKVTKYLQVEEAADFGKELRLTPALIATLVKAAFVAEDLRAGGSGKLTIRKARYFSKKFKLNKRILGCLEVRVRRDS